MAKRDAERAAETPRESGYAARRARAAERAAGRGDTPAPEAVTEPSDHPEEPSADASTEHPADPSAEAAESSTTTLTAEALPAPEDFPQASETRTPAFSLGNLTPVLLVRAAHPRQALLTAIGMGVAAVLAGRPGRELLLVMGTVLVGQVVLGWANDLVDRRRDARHVTPGSPAKPLADGRLEPGTVWFCLAIAFFLVVPLAVANGLYAGAAYLASLAIGLLGQWTWLRRGFLSWVPWAAAFALYPAFLSYGGWGGQERGAPPELVITALAALLGVGVHLLTSLWGLVADNEDRWTYLPLKLGLRIGASRLLWVAVAWTVLSAVALAWAGSRVGLSQAPL